MTRAILSIVDGTVEGPRGPVLAGVDLAVASGRVTALLGPSGSGKSALLRAMSGEPPAPGWRLRGRFLFRDEALSHLPGEPPSRLRAVAWLPQGRHRRPHPGESFSRPPAVAAWREALIEGPSLVLLDEPERGEDGDIDTIREAVLKRPEGQSVVVITHNLRLAEGVADDVIFICAGDVKGPLPAKVFFEDPPDNTMARFVHTGNTWPSSIPAAPALPSHFCWVLLHRLAGMGRPGLLRDIDEDLAAIAHAGIDHLVTLTEYPLHMDVVRSHGIASLHFPIRDMGVPSIGDAASMCGRIERLMEGGHKVALHCHAGLGRTGTMLAAMLVWQGATAPQAVEKVRQVRARYIQSAAQHAFIREMASRYGPR